VASCHQHDAGAGPALRSDRTKAERLLLNLVETFGDRAQAKLEKTRQLIAQIERDLPR
jgi:hypothetical protein